jgi:hypothetical protein
VVSPSTARQIPAVLDRRSHLTTPRLEVRYGKRDARSTGGPGEKLTLRWGYKVTVTNLAKQDAIDVRVVKSNNPQLSTLPESHVKGLEKVEVENYLTKDVDRETVVQAQHDFHGRLEPPELKDLRLVLRYKNESGVVFFTTYKRVDGTDVNEVSRLWKSGAA